MFDRTRVGGAVLGAFTAPKAFAGWSKVVLQVDDDTEYTAGDDTGRTLTAYNPFGTQKMAEDMLARIRGSAYQAYSGTTALLDPAAELGDAVEIRGYYGGLYSRTRNLDKLYTADVAAPTDEEVDHEYPYKSSQERIVTRKLKETKASLQVLGDKILAEVEAREQEGRALRASLTIQADRITQEVTDRVSADSALAAGITIQADRITQEVTARTNADGELRAALNIQAGQIAAKVSKNGGSQSFGWDLTDSYQRWTANGAEIVRFDSLGAYIRGRIEALSGRIGGFDINDDHLSYNGQTFGGTNYWGCYFGREGLQMGNRFSVDMSGYLHAASGRFDGEVRAGSIAYGGDDGTLWGEAITSESLSGGWGGQIESGGISTYNTTGGINASLASADFANSVFNGWAEASVIGADRMYLAGYPLGLSTLSYKDGYGNTRTGRFVMWRE